jgi:DNA-binding response OmpR family regulator
MDKRLRVRPRTQNGNQVRPRILVVDDEPDITAVLKIGLERRGFSVDVYNDSLDALKSVVLDKYSVALIDIRMPKMNGFELFRAFRKVDGRAGVVFMTAFDIFRSEFKMMFPDIEPLALLRKPFSIQDLLTTIGAYLDEEQERRSGSASQRNTLVKAAAPADGRTKRKEE